MFVPTLEYENCLYFLIHPKELLIEENIESCQTLPIKIVFVISNADTVWNTKSVKLYLSPLAAFAAVTDKIST